MTVDKLDEHLKADCDAMKELIAQIPSKRGYKGDLGRSDPTDIMSSAHAVNDGDFRALEAMLTKLDPYRVWGGLSQTTTPEGLTLYLCPRHLAVYNQAVQS